MLRQFWPAPFPSPISSSFSSFAFRVRSHRVYYARSIRFGRSTRNGPAAWRTVHSRGSISRGRHCSCVCDVRGRACACIVHYRPPSPAADLTSSIVPRNRGGTRTSHVSPVPTERNRARFVRTVDRTYVRARIVSDTLRYIYCIIRGGLMDGEPDNLCAVVKDDEKNVIRTSGRRWRTTRVRGGKTTFD